jgi:hypothetical protein
MAGSEDYLPVLSDSAPDRPGGKAASSAVIERKDTNIPDVSAAESVEFDAAAMPKGTIDPVYEAKARVLNRAVRAWRHCWTSV